MTEREKVVGVMMQFLHAGLVLKSPDLTTACVWDDILGIGMGEQGFVTSPADVHHVMVSTRKENCTDTHSVSCDRVEVRFHSESFATVCALVRVVSQSCSGQAATSCFNQLLTLSRRGEEWRICALHASTPVLTEESLAAYPLKLAEKTLQSLKDRIGEQAYQAEERFRQAILTDAIAFYIINLTQDCCEKCQCDEELCLKMEEGASYSAAIANDVHQYVAEADYMAFCQQYSLAHMLESFRSGVRELTLEYQLRHQGGYLWASTVARPIVDNTSGEEKALLYVRNIDKSKRMELELQKKATFDGMTKLYKRESMSYAVEQSLRERPDGVTDYFVMLDIDNFKKLNDSYGHPIGDLVLVALSDILRDLFWEDGVVGRMGGDEFGIFFRSRSQGSDLEFRLQDLTRRFQALRIPEIGDSGFSCSIGVTLRMGDERFENLYKNADQALYQSKKEGKARITFFRD